MKKTVTALVAFALVGFSASAQSEDPVLMRINGRSITRSEFEYSFNKNNADGVLDKKEIKEYIPLFVDFKLKVAAAEDARIDTLASIKKELDGYKEQLVLPTLVSEQYIEERARETYNKTAERFAGQDLLNASHILVLMRQDATPEQQKAAKAKIDSIYTALKGGADFAELAKACSDDKASAARGGSLGQFGKGMMIPDFEKAAYALQKGEMSEPVLTPVGYHIIKMTDRHPFEPYEFHRDNIIRFLESRGVKEASAQAYVDSLMKTTGKTRPEVIDVLYKELIAKDSETRYLAQEYYDGTLMYEVSKREVWDKAATDEDALAKCFSKNKKKYVWDAPRFKGIVIHAKDEATLQEAKKALKGVDEAKWAQTLISKFNTDSVKLVRVERGIYKEGENAYVNNLVFKKGDKKEMKDFPFTDVYGKLQKKPKSYKDVKGMVTTDLQSEMEKQWIESLHKKYSVEIDESALSTVNKH